MKKLILLLLFIPLVSFGQDEEVISFDGYDLLGNYISKIKKREIVSSYDGIEHTKIFWENPDNNKWIGKFNLFPYFGSDGNLVNRFDAISVYGENPSFAHITKDIVQRNGSKENYKYFTKHSFGKENDKIAYYHIDYGLRLLRVNPISEFGGIDDLFYQKTVSYNGNKTTISNKYNIAVEFDNVFHKLWVYQTSLDNYFWAAGEKQKLLVEQLKKQFKGNVWINLDDELTLGYNYYNNFNLPSSIYPDDHRISLNKDFEFNLDISGKDREDELLYQDHFYNISLGLKNSRDYIKSLESENAISYEIRYISKSTNVVESVETYCSTCSPTIIHPYPGSFVFTVTKKIDGIIYEEKKVFSKDLERSLMYKNGKGKVKIFRRGKRVMLALNGYLLDVTENHNFKNHTILFGSKYSEGWGRTRGIKDYDNENGKFDFIITQTLNKKIDFSAPAAGNWKGNGSGFFISKSGYLATNYHVIEDASEIEVEYINNQKSYKYKAEVIQTDPSNDLAILKIKDPAFNDLSSIPYNVKTRSSDVGSSVFALGFPMALSGMGKEIKFTDGKISSKTGFNGDIRTYQTTTPIQGGNSGGPLFDYKGNLVGINSAKISSSKADNVSYSIKSSYLNNLMDVLPESVSIPSDTSLSTKSLTDLIKILSNYVVLIKVK